MLLLAACAGDSGRESGRLASPRVARAFIDDGRPLPKGGGTFKLGSPYEINGRTYVPREDRDYVEDGVGSWYGADFHGRLTANGEIYDRSALTAAHRTMPLPSYAYVTNLDTGVTLLVRVNDRGPYVNDRIIDLSQAAAKAIGYEGRGLAHVRVRYAGPAPLDGNTAAEVRFYQQATAQRVASAPAAWQSRRGPPDAPPLGSIASGGGDAYRPPAPTDRRPEPFALATGPGPRAPAAYDSAPPAEPLTDQGWSIESYRGAQASRR